MEKTLIVIAATGLCTVLSRQYHFVYDRKIMTEARRYCREKYTDLATIENMEDVMTLNNVADLSKMIYEEYSYGAWIGLYDDVNSWRWSLSSRSFYEAGEMDFRKWLPEVPNNAGSEQLCTNMGDTGLWDDERCDLRYRAVCVDVRGQKVTFVLTTDSVSWSEAQSYCRSHHTDLASVRNMAENQKIRKLAAGQRVWIGLFRDSWKWTDGSNSSFRYWRRNHPNNVNWNEICVAANFEKSGKWEDWSCEWKKAFICYSNPVKKQVIKLRLKTSSSLDLNDPAVMEQILKQLKQRLKEQKVNEDISLSWTKQSDGKQFHKINKDKKTRNGLCDGRY